MQTAPWAQDVDGVRPQIVGASTSGSGELRRRSVPKEEEEEDEEDDYVQQEPPSENDKRWGTWLATTALIDVVSSGAIVITSFSYAYHDAGVSLWCMGIQAFSHLLASLMLVLRFCGENSLPKSDEASVRGLLKQRRRRLLNREQFLSITMGLTMLLSSAGLLFKAFRKIKFWHRWHQDVAKREAMDSEVQWVIEFLAWYGWSAYTLQAVFRFVAARKLRRDLVWHSFWASMVSLLFLFVMGVAASNMKEWSWKAEPICAIALAFLTMIEAIRIVISYLDDMEMRLRHNPRA